LTEKASQRFNRNDEVLLPDDRTGTVVSRRLLKNKKLAVLLHEGGRVEVSPHSLRGYSSYMALCEEIMKLPC